MSYFTWYLESAWAEAGHTPDLNHTSRSHLGCPGRPHTSCGSAKQWVCRVLCSRHLDPWGCCHRTGKEGRQPPQARPPVPSLVIPATTWAGRLQNTVTNIFTYWKIRGLEVFCSFLESTCFPTEKARLLSATLRLRLNIFHTNFFQQTVQLLRQPNLSCPVTGPAQGNGGAPPERDKAIDPSTTLLKWGGTN